MKSSPFKKNTANTSPYKNKSTTPNTQWLDHVDNNKAKVSGFQSYSTSKIPNHAVPNLSSSKMLFSPDKNTKSSSTKETYDAGTEKNNHEQYYHQNRNNEAQIKDLNDQIKKLDLKNSDLSTNLEIHKNLADKLWENNRKLSTFIEKMLKSFHQLLKKQPFSELTKKQGQSKEGKKMEKNFQKKIENKENDLIEKILKIYENQSAALFTNLNSFSEEYYGKLVESNKLILEGFSNNFKSKSVEAKNFNERIKASSLIPSKKNENYDNFQSLLLSDKNKILEDYKNNLRKLLNEVKKKHIISILNKQKCSLLKNLKSKKVVERDALNKKIQQLTIEINNLKKTIEESEIKKKNFQEKIFALDEQNEKLSKSNEELTEKCKNFVKPSESYSPVNDLSDKSFQNSNKKLLKSENKKNLKFKKNFKNDDKNNESQESHDEIANKETASTPDDSVVKNEEINIWKKNIEDREEIIRISYSKIQQLEADNKQIRNEKDKIIYEKEILDQHYQILYNQLISNDPQQREQQLLQSYNNELLKLQASYNAHIEGINQNYSEQFQKAQNEYENLLLQYNELKSKNENIEENEIEAYKKKLEAYKKELELLNKNIELYKKNNNELVQDLQKNSKVFEEFKKTAGEKENKLETEKLKLEKECKSENKKNLKLKKNLKNDDKNNETQESHDEIANKKTASTPDDSVVKNEEINIWKKNIEDREEIIRISYSKIQQLEADNKQIRNEKDKIIYEKEILDQHYQILYNQLISNDPQQREQQLLQSYNNELLKLQASYNAHIEGINQNYSEQFQKAQNEYENLLLQYNELKSKNENIEENEIEAYKKKLEAYKKELELLNKNIEFYKKNNNELVHDLQKNSKIFEEFKKTAGEKENTLVTEKLKLEKECKRLTDVLNSRIENIENERVNQELKTLVFFNKSVSEELRNQENETRRLQQEFYDDKVKIELKYFEEINKKLLKEMKI